MVVILIKQLGKLEQKYLLYMHTYIQVRIYTTVSSTVQAADCWELRCAYTYLCIRSLLLLMQYDKFLCDTMRHCLFLCSETVVQKQHW